MSETDSAGDGSLEHVTRRRLIQGGAAVAAGAWAVPIVTSIAAPAAAASGQPGGGQGCLSQTFTSDRNGASLALAGGYGNQRWVHLALGGSFTAISSILVTLDDDPSDPFEDGDVAYVTFQLEDGRPGSIGVTAYGSGPHPVQVGFSPSGGYAPEQSYEAILRDGVADLMIMNAADGGFRLRSIVVEVCGTLA